MAPNTDAPPATASAQLSLEDLFDSLGDLEPRGHGAHADRAITVYRPRNFRLADAEALTRGSLRKKASRNRDAIRLLKQIEEEGRPATPEEQERLALYTGWGALPAAFDPEHPKWGKFAAELKALLGDDEWASAMGSTPNAHMTDPVVVREVYRMLEHMGFTGRRFLETSAGTGHFLGLCPEHLMDTARWVAIEKDSLTGRILKLLYPEADVRIRPFEKVSLGDDFYDAVVGNVPFGVYPVFDPTHNREQFKIHDYFVVRSTAHARPGGLIALITSRGTLDKRSDAARRRIAERADLVAAVRLPNMAFRAIANTAVVADLLILRRRAPGEAPSGPAWMDTVPVDTPEGPAYVNEYFAAHPEQILGTLTLAKGSHAHGEVTVEPEPARSLADALADARARLPRDIYRAAQPVLTGGRSTSRSHKPLPDELAATVKDGAFVSLKGILMRRDGPFLVPDGCRGRRERQVVRWYVRLRDAAREVLRTQREDEPDEVQETARARLNDEYDAFVLRFGPINREQIVQGRQSTYVLRPNISAFRRDPDAMLVAALEDYDPETGKAGKAPIFTQRVVRAVRPIDRVEDPVDALLVCLDRVGRVDLREIGRLWEGRTEEEVVQALGARIYQDPTTREWLTDDAYLSGDVRSKLEEATAAAEADPRWQPHVEALRAVQPRPIPPSEIDATLGAPWIPVEDIKAFIHATLPESQRGAVAVIHVPSEALWKVRPDSWLRDTPEARVGLGTKRADAYRLVEDLLNQRATEITDEVEETDPETGKKRTKRVRNPEETLAAQEKQAEIRERFERWVWSDGDRAARLAEVYNRTFNSRRVREFDGSHLTFPGMNAAIRLDPHQTAVIWRILQTGNTLIAHCVGAGKTYVMAAAAMKQRQLGLANKPMIAARNHMLLQLARDFIRLYPEARLLVAEDEDFAGDNRRLFLARAAAGDFDAILITHSAFTRLSVSPEFEQEYLADEIKRYEELLAAAEEADDRLTVKELSSALAKFEARLELLVNRESKDRHLSFEEVGIDQLYVDEAHHFKNLDSPTKVRGIPRAVRPSQRATDLMMKCLYLERLRPGYGVVFATGTPISNTLAEVHVNLRYLAQRLLDRCGIRHFDAFVATFVKPVPTLELAPDGSRYRLRTRFFFTNLADLIALFRTVTDVQMAEPPEPISEEEAAHVRATVGILRPEDEVEPTFPDEPEALAA